MTKPNLNFDSDWIAQAIPRVLQAMSGKVFCADDIHGVVAEPISPARWGALVRQLGPHLELVGYVRSTRKGRKHGLLRQWRIKE